MHEELPAQFDGKKIEEKWYSFWEEGDFFSPKEGNAPVFSISIPPPNVTGVLHVGHALVNSLIDTLVRFKRMQGFRTLWVPGTDHAGISTQSVVEKSLRNEGLTKESLGREKFIEKAFLWKEKYEKGILDQLKKIGSSADWSRLRFTMDPICSKAVYTMFYKLYEKGLIYRGDYLINWDPVAQTALSDEELEYEEVSSFLWTLRYFSEDNSFFVDVSTTRPETCFGDMAVAVHPEDARYINMVGKYLIQPLTGRKIPLIQDHFVDPAFGTGAVKITPGHDPNDYEAGIRHNLDVLSVFDKKGCLNHFTGEFEGMKILDARTKVVAKFKELGLLVKEEPHQLRVPISYRSKGRIEPMVSKQWFIRMRPYVESLKEAVESGDVELIPSSWKNTYFHWVENLHDWCISRQLYWGHQIPIWYNKKDPEKILCSQEGNVPEEVEKDPEMWVRDNDVLDTWFSSALWPFAALGWPDKTPDLESFYPNSALITGHDILFFWVTRMLFMGREATGQWPFSQVFLHGLIFGKSFWRYGEAGDVHYLSREETKSLENSDHLPPGIHSKWEKMSKTKGNVIDPIEMIDQFGADATRITLISSPASSRQIDLDRRKFEEFKNFANKTWNAARFVLMQLDKNSSWKEEVFSEKDLGWEEKWILTRLDSTIEHVLASFEKFHFDKALNTVYKFLWDDFCAVYVELCKPFFAQEREGASLKRQILFSVLTKTILLLHPFAPFITEEIFKELKRRSTNISLESQEGVFYSALKSFEAPAAIIAPYPQRLEKTYREEQVLFEGVLTLIKELRALKATWKLSHKDVLQVVKEEGLNPLIDEILTTQVGIQWVEKPENGTFTLQATGRAFIIVLPEKVLAENKEKQAKEEAKRLLQIEKLERQLNSPGFLEKAPAHVVENLQKELQTLKTSLHNCD